MDRVLVLFLRVSSKLVRAIFLGRRVTRSIMRWETPPGQSGQVNLIFPSSCGMASSARHFQQKVWPQAVKSLGGLVSVNSLRQRGQVTSAYILSYYVSYYYRISTAQQTTLVIFIGRQLLWRIIDCIRFIYSTLLYMEGISNLIIAKLAINEIDEFDGLSFSTNQTLLRLVLLLLKQIAEWATWLSIFICIIYFRGQDFLRAATHSLYLDPRNFSLHSVDLF